MPTGVIIILIIFTILLFLEGELDNLSDKLRSIKLVFPYVDMFDDDFGYDDDFSARDLSGDDDRVNSLANRHLFVHGSKGGEMIEPANKDKEQLLLPGTEKIKGKIIDCQTGEIIPPERFVTQEAKDKINGKTLGKTVISDAIKAKKEEDAKKVEIVEVKEEKPEEPDFILLDLNK